MKLARSIATQRLGQWGLAVALTVVSTTALAVTVGNTLEIPVGKAIVRTPADVQKDDFRYGPKQDYDAKTKETHIYLPYGRTDGIYYEANNVNINGPHDSGMQGANPKDRHGYITLGFKLHFDNPISAFRLRVGQSEVGLAANVAAGFEYSTDGKKWTAIRQIVGPFDKMLDPILDPDTNGKVSGLKTQVLYIRCYTRFVGDDKAKPDTSDHHWLEVPMCGGASIGGDGGWWFGARQWNLWVTAAE